MYPFKASANSTVLWIPSILLGLIFGLEIWRWAPWRPAVPVIPLLAGRDTEWVVIQPDGSFSAKFVTERFFDIELAPTKKEGKFVRALIRKGIYNGKTKKVKTMGKGISVTLITFTHPQLIMADLLNAKRESLVPGIAKLFGALPNVVALVCVESQGAWLVAPQLGGQGASENRGLMRDLLKIDDEVDPKILAKL